LQYLPSNIYLSTLTAITMTNFIPIFPMETVVYPEEIIKYTITEPKYIQLINECIEDQKQFGIQVILEGKVMEYGTLMDLIRINKNKTDNSIEIETKGVQVFRVLEIIDHLPEKMYSGAIVTYPENDKMKVHPKLSKLIFDEVRRLFERLNIENMLPSEIPDWTSYDIAHRFGLTRLQEYELLTIFNEVQRMEYLRRYLNRIMPEVEDIELIKSKINLN
jgi:Lon protease-like protein